MTAQKDPQKLADDLTGSIGYMRTLVRAADDKVRLYFEDEELLGPYGEVLRRHAMELSSLLSLTGHLLAKADEEAGAAANFLYRWPLSSGE